MVDERFKEYYAFLSGEHETIPIGELKAILEAEDVEYVISKVYDQVVTFKARNLNPKVITFRGGMVKEVGLLISICENPLSEDEVLHILKDVSWEHLIKPYDTFLVRCKRIKRYLEHLNTTSIERLLGALIAGKTRSKVNVHSPNKMVKAFLTSNVLITGLLLSRVNTKEFLSRKPSTRPFFHPSALDPKLSRVFVNLSRVKREQLFLDPFCGTGGFLIEAALIGAYIIGSDIRRDMVEGTMKNLRSMGIEPLGIVRADATTPPWHRVDAIATDPPYGRSSTTLGRSVDRIVYDFLNSHADRLKRGGYVCYALPHDVEVQATIPKKLYDIVEVHSMRVHKSLTRMIIIVKRR